MSKLINGKSVEEQARDYFIYGYHCSEAVLKAFNEYYDMKLSKKVLRMATGLGAGLGKAKCCCGTLTAGTLVLSSFYGRTDPRKDDGLAFDLAKELHNRFIAQFKHSCCRVLSKNVKWGHPDHTKQCSQYVYTASKIVREIIEETRKNIG